MKHRRITIYPSLLAVEKRNTLRRWEEVEPFVEGAHIDPMDGIFVKNTTRFDPAFVRKLKTSKVKDVHLMVARPLSVLPAYVRAGAREVDIHIETLSDPREALRQVRKQFPKLRIFLALNPETSIKKVYPYLALINGVLCMTVRPGKGGQPFLSSVLRRIRELHRRAPTLPIKVDGGINNITAKKVIAAGATILVSGAYIFQHKNPKVAIHTLQSCNNFL